MAGSKPTLFPEFARLDLPNGPGGNLNVVEPSAGKKDSGWDVGERPARETFNWLHRVTNEWLEYIDGCLDELIASNGPNTQFAQDIAATSGFNFVVGPGKYTLEGDELEKATNTILSLGPNSTNFVWLDVANATVQFVDEAGVPPELDGGPDIMPLFRVTVGPTEITGVEDLRSWLNLARPEAITGQYTNWNAGLTTDSQDLGAADSTPTPDMSAGNSFFYRPNGTVTSFTFQDPTNRQPAGQPNASGVFTLVVILDNSGQTGSFSGKWEFVNQPGGTYSINGATALKYVISGVYDPVLDLYHCTVTPQAS